MGPLLMTETHNSPLRIEHDCFGTDVPFYALRYNKKGTCISPEARQKIIQNVKDDKFTDIIFYSHGWNNDWDAAQYLYSTFLRGISDMAVRHGGGLPANFKPLFVGAIWPSAALTWPGEKPPHIAALGRAPEFEALLMDIETEDRARIEDILGSGETVNESIALELAALIAPIIKPEDDPVDGVAQELSAEQLLQLWKLDEVMDDPNVSGGGFDDGGLDVTDGELTSDTITAAGLLDKLRPRNLLRLATVYKMKDRAGVVGANGVKNTLEMFLGMTSARLHLVGHSYGCKVMLTASALAHVPRKIRSEMLYQPAISKFACDPQIGGLRAALGNVETPICCTYSKNDVPLHKIFHRMLRRKDDVGELQFASGSKYEAMGGYGPVAARVKNFPIPSAGTPYPYIRAETQMLALNGAVGIDGHSDVNNPFTYWAMLNQLR